MKKTFNLKGYALASIAAAVLTACGGGGGSSAPAVTVTPVLAPETTVALPTPTVSTPADASTAGTLQTLAFVSALTSSQENVAITGSGTTSVMTFSSPAFTVTGATSSSTTFNTGGGLVKANGNVVLFCANGKQTPSGNDTTDLSFQVAGKVFISANLVAVNDASVLAGLTIKTEDCAGVTDSTTYNANGTSTRVEPSGTTALNVTQTAAFVSTAGFTGPDGSNYKTRIYKYVTGGATRYFVVTLINQVNPNGTFVNVGYQVP